MSNTKLPNGLQQEEAVESLITPRGKGDVCQIDRISWLSFVSFTWMFGYMWKSFKKQMPDKVTSINDLWTNSIFDSANVNMTRLEHLWMAELKRRPQNPNFTRVVLRFFRFRLALSSLIFFFCIVFGFIGPTCIIRGLITFLEKPTISDGKIDRSYGWTLAVGMLFVEILRVLAYGATWAISYRSAIRLRGAILSLLYKQISGAKSLSGKTSAEIVNIYANDGQRIFDAVTFAPLVLIGPLVLVGGLVYLLRIIGPLSLLAISVFLLFDVFQAVFGITMVKCRNKAIKNTEKRMNLLGEIIASIRTIKLYVWEDLFLRRMNEIRMQESKFLKIAGYAQSMAVVSGSIVPVVATIVMVLAIVYSGADLLASDAFSAITVFFVMLFGIRMIPYGVRYLSEARQSLQKIEELLLVDKFSNVYPAPHNPKISLNMRNCTFSWTVSSNNTNQNHEAKLIDDLPKAANGEAIPLNGFLLNRDEAESNQGTFLLKNLTFSIERGELVGVCGIIGSGKTALLNAITGHMIEKTGTLEVAGTVAFCSQVPCILNDTIRENILFGQPMNLQRYDKVISSAQLNRDLERLPSNELSRVCASQLSGGQRARIAIARALYSNRDVYLFDDVFASIDKRVASNIFDLAIKKALNSKTVFLATNDPTHLTQCDKIIFLEKGEISGYGSHQELLEKSSNYQQFFESLKQSELSQSEEDIPKVAQVSIQSSLKHLALKEDVLSETSQQEENSGMDAVKKETYLEYVKSGGGYPVLTLLSLGFLFNVASNIFSSYWLSKWMNDVHKEALIGQQNTRRIQYTNTLANSPDVVFYTSIYALGLFVLLFSGILKAVVFVKFTIGASTSLHNRMLKRVLYAVCKFFHTTPSGQILNRFSRDVDELDVKLPFSIEAFLQCMITCIGFLLMIIWVFPVFLLPSTPIFALFLLFVLCFRAGIRLLKRLENNSRSPLFEHIAFSLDNLTTIHSYGQTCRYLDQLKALLDENSSAMFLYHSAMRWQAVWLDLLVVAITFTVSVLIVALAGHVSPSEAGLAISFALQMSGLFQFAVRSLTELETKMTSVERISYYINNIETEPLNTDPSDLPVEWPTTGEIVFENTLLRYSQAQAPAIQDVSFQINDAEKVGIVGRTGSGKSSLCNALFRMYPLESGRVLVDRWDINSISLHRLRKSIAVIPQEPSLFSGSLRFNLDPNGVFSDAQIWESINRMDLDEEANFFAQQKLDYQIEPNATNLSSGQRQLICMARALLRNTQAIVLDEATSSIDMQTDAQLRKALKRFSSDGKSVMLIAHRQANIAEMDRVFEMEDGKLTIRRGSSQRMLEDSNPSISEKPTKEEEA